ANGAGMRLRIPAAGPFPPAAAHPFSPLLRSVPMLQLFRILHVLAVGLWFGTAVFFSFPVALTLFGSFEELAAKPQDERPLWFPVPDEFNKDAALRKEQGTRAAGFAISPLFDRYFLIQTVSGVLALATALAFGFGNSSTSQRGRVLTLSLAVLSLGPGWWLEHRVSELRHERNQAGDVVLRGEGTNPAAAKEAADQARTEFGRWHTYSLLWNFVTLGLVTAATAL